MPTSYGAKNIGSVDALAGRLRSARQRAAGMLNQALRDAEKDAIWHAWNSPGLVAEREATADALAALLQRPETPADRAAAHELERVQGLHQLGDSLLTREERLEMLEASMAGPLPVVLTP